MPNRRIEEQLEIIASIRQSGANATTVATLRQLLGDRVSLVVSKAAAAAGQLQMKELIPDLLQAYPKLFENGVKRDPQCWGKAAIAEALIKLDYSEAEPFLRGINYRQWEPVWGTESDTASALRAACTLALVQCTDLLRDEKLLHLVRALTDAEAAVRVEAVRAVEQMEGREAVLLLRLKARVPDREAGITGQVFESLLGIEREEAIAFVLEFVQQRGWAERDEEVAELAALALGRSRIPQALAVLQHLWSEGPSAIGAALLRAISASRLPEAIDFLVALVSEGRVQQAVIALEALSIHSDSEGIRDSVAQAVEARGDTRSRRRLRGILDLRHGARDSSLATMTVTPHSWFDPIAE